MRILIAAAIAVAVLIPAQAQARKPLTTGECSAALRGSALSHDDDIHIVEGQLGPGAYLANGGEPLFVRRQGKYRVVMSGVFWVPGLRSYQSVPFFCLKRSDRRIKDQARTRPAGF